MKHKLVINPFSSVQNKKQSTSFQFEMQSGQLIQNFELAAFSIVIFWK